MNKYHTIYGLLASGQTEFFYIGMTCKPIEARRSVHVSHAKMGRETKNPKTRAIIASNYDIEIKAIEEGVEDKSVALQRENFWIEHYRKLGHPLTNSSRRFGIADQFEVLYLMANGFTAKKSGERLGVSPKTIESYLASLRKEHEAKTNAHLVRIAWRKGILNHAQPIIT
jgi:DNA-binding CsgD family transcriptional regulator